MFKPTFQFSIYCTYILYLYKSALKNQSCWISYHDFNIEARKPGTKPSLRKICPSSSVLSIKSPVHVTVLLHVHVYLLFFLCHITSKSCLGKASSLKNTEILITERLCCFSRIGPYTESSAWKASCDYLVSYLKNNMEVIEIL